jgi:thiol-disulfide isomerase/thioredoxin
MDNNSLKFRVARRKQTRSVVVLIAGVPAIWILLVSNGLKADEPKPMDQKAPELTGISQWINAKPLTLKDLRGKVVVLHFWTFGCINCRHNLPYYNRWQSDLAKDDLRIIGVHTPETAAEADEKNVVARVRELGIKYPVAVDNESATWKAFKNHYWPSIYLIDKQGRVRFRWDGELEYEGSGGDKLLRDKIKALLAEPSKP